MNQWEGYRVPHPDRLRFKREHLIQIAQANGLDLSADLLRKWRQWRLIPAPTAGGPTGKGRGKGQAWPTGAGWRTAWLARWKADGLSYDCLRIAIWPWTDELERDRPDELRASLVRFLEQDESFEQDRLAALTPEAQEAMEIYRRVVIQGARRSDDYTELLEAHGLQWGSPEFREHRERLQKVNLDTMKAAIDRVTVENLRSYVARVRSTADIQETLIVLLWTSPLALARIVVRELSLQPEVSATAR